MSGYIGFKRKIEEQLNCTVSYWMEIEITPWLVSVHDFCSRVMKDS